MGKTLIPPEPAEIHEVALREALEERYLQYALSTIMHRALPVESGTRWTLVSWLTGPEPLK